MNSFASFHLRAAAVYAILGMAIGIVMAAMQNFTVAPAHAHLLLLGWVSTFLYGLFFAACPRAAESGLARWHLLAAHGGVVLMVPGIALVKVGVAAGESLAITGSVLSISGIVLFSGLVFMLTGETDRRPAATRV